MIHTPEQYRHELRAWERALDFYKQENAFLKMYLSELIDKYDGAMLIDPAEFYNNKFVFVDEHILTLQQDIRLQEQMLKLHLKGDHQQDEMMDRLQKRLRNEMEKFEIEITTLVKDFNKKITETLGS